MRSRWNLPILIAYMTMSVLVLGFVIVHLGVEAPWSHPYTVSATFADADGILVNNEVYMNGVRVGRVSDVHVANGTAHVTMTLDDTAALPLHTDATAQVRKKNLLGETYIDLQRGSATCATCTMRSGATISIDHTVPITEIDQVLAIFDPATVQRVQLLINAVGEGTNGNGANMNAGATSMADLMQSLDGPAVALSVHKQQLGDIVLELQRLYDMLAQERANVRDGLVTWNQVMAQMAAQDGQLGGTIAQADALVSSLDTLLNGEGGNITATLNELPGALRNTEAFLSQTDVILNGLAPVRTDIHDIFPHLASSFADTDANGQHFWSVYSVNCPSSCAGSAPAAPSGPGNSTASFWTTEAGS